MNDPEYELFLKSQGIKSKPLGFNAASTELLELDPADWVQACKVLKKSKNMTMLNYMTALEIKNAYQVIIQLDNMLDKKYLVLKANLDKSNPVLASLTEIYASADWQEREAFDMIGINFDGHPNLKRILNPDKWEGHPLRKDYIGPVDELNQPIQLKA